MALRKWRCLALLGILCWGSLALAKQGATGRIEGRVVKDGEGVGAVVVLVNELKVTEVTDGEGAFAFEGLPTGNYTLIFTLGDNSLVRTNVMVSEDRTHEFEVEVDWDLGVREEVTVTAVERAAKIVDAPAAVTSIPAEQVEQKAATGQVPKVLEFTPGAEVTQSGLYDFNFNTRGFNSSLNRRISTYIDGRDVGVVLLGAQEWAAISGGLDDVANLEFIRGPSAALYGANASSGVVNITTKAPADSVGSMLRISGGVINTLSADDSTRLAESAKSQDVALNFRQAGKIGSGWFYKVSAGTHSSGDFSVSRDPDVVDKPEYYLIEDPDEETSFCLLIGERGCLPKEKSLFLEQDVDIRFASLRFDKFLIDRSLLTFEAGFSEISGPVFQTGIGRVQNIDSQRPFYRVAWSNDHWNVLAHYAERDGNQANLTKALVVDYELLTDTQRYGVEAQWNRSFGGEKGRVVVGAAHTQEHVDTSDPDSGRQTIVYEPIDAHRQAIFSQVDWRANRFLTLVFAGRVDWNTLHDTQFSPKAALVYNITPKNSLRLTYNQAFQVANYSELFLHTRISFFPLAGFASAICTSPALERPIDCDAIDIEQNGFVPILAVGNPDLQLEKTKAWEIGYTGLLANKVFVTVDYYNAKNEDFITDLVPQVGSGLGNLEGCLDQDGNQETDPRNCPINNHYKPWFGPADWESTYLIDPSPFNPQDILAADALRNAVDNSVGGNSLGFRLAQDLDGSTVVVGRTYTNVGEVDTQGVDFGIQYFVTRALSIQASYSWFDFEIIDTDLDVFGLLQPNSPENKASLSLSFRNKRWAASFGGRWVEGFRWSAGVFEGDVPDYYTFDVGASYAFNDLIRLGVNLANANDNVHRQTFGGDLLHRRALMHLTFTW